MTITGQLANFLAALKYEHLPEQVMDKAKSCILDSIGCMLAGSSQEMMPALVEEFCSSDDVSAATVLGYGRKTGLRTAAMLNGTMGHAVEMDDVHKEAKSHPGTVVVPAALSMAEGVRGSGQDLILAVTAGYETMLRIGSGINASAHRLQGWHATGTCGTFGAAAAVSKLACFSAEQLVNALGLAGTQSAGLWAFTADGANCKMFHAGKAALSGMLAQQLAAAGMSGPSQIIEAADGGFFKASSLDYSFEKVTAQLGDRYFINEVSVKPFSCCRSMHPPIEAMLRLKEHDIQAEDIGEIVVRTYQVAKVQCGYIQVPRNVTDAKFSIPYGVAVAFYDGSALLDQFKEERISDERVLALAAKVRVEADEKYTAAYPANWGCTVEITLASGEKLSQEILNPKGDITNPMSQQELEDKFRYLAQPVIGSDRVSRIIDMINSLENIDDIGVLTALLHK